MFPVISQDTPPPAYEPPGPEQASVANNNHTNPPSPTLTELEEDTFGM
jgi:hypothetical protein